MPEIRAAFFDIDGTLLPFEDEALPRSTVRALRALREKGIRIYIATGRPPVHLPLLKALQEVEFDGYVTMNGQYCYEGDTVLHECTIPTESLVNLLPYANENNISVGFIEKDYAYFNLINDLSAPFTEHFQQGLDDPQKRLGTYPVYQLSAFLKPEYEAEFLQHCPGCLAVRWSDEFADVFPQGGGKPAGLKAVLAHHGWDASQCIAFGDGDNDVTMLQYAGIGVAMGNARPNVQAAADYVTASDREDGIEKALQHFGIL